MLLTEQEKLLIKVLKFGDEILEFDDGESRYKYEVEKIRGGDFQVAKFAGTCIGIEFYETPNGVVRFIEKGIVEE